MRSLLMFLHLLYPTFSSLFLNKKLNFLLLSNKASNPHQNLCMLLLLHPNHVNLILSLYPNFTRRRRCRCQKRFMWKNRILCKFYGSTIEGRRRNSKTWAQVNGKVLNKLEKNSSLSFILLSSQRCMKL